MNLQFLLPEVPGLGVWQLDTSSFYSIVNVNSGVKLVRSVCGHVRMVPLVLSLVPQEVTPEGGTKKTVRVLKLTSRATLADILRAAALPPARVLMPAPDTETPEDLFPQEVLEEAEAPGPTAPAPLAPEPATPQGELFPQEATSPQPSDGDREKRLLWQEIKGLRASSGVTNNQVRLWFKKYYELEVSPAEVEGDLPPQKVTPAMLKRLHVTLRQRQPPLGEGAQG